MGLPVPPILALAQGSADHLFAQTLRLGRTGYQAPSLLTQNALSPFTDLVSNWTLVVLGNDSRALCWLQPVCIILTAA